MWDPDKFPLLLYYTPKFNLKKKEEIIMKLLLCYIQNINFFNRIHDVEYPVNQKTKKTARECRIFHAILKLN